MTAAAAGDWQADWLSNITIYGLLSLYTQVEVGAVLAMMSARGTDRGKFCSCHFTRKFIVVVVVVVVTVLCLWPRVLKIAYKWQQRLRAWWLQQQQKNPN